MILLACMVTLGAFIWHLAGIVDRHPPYRMEQQHRPFFGWVERHITSIAMVTIYGVILLGILYYHLDDLVSWVGHH